MESLKALLLDVGGVLMTNGWDRILRKKTSELFDIEYDEMTDRHHLIFDTYETGKLTFDEYLTRIIFFKKRSFTIQDIRDFIFESVHPYSDMMAYIQELKEKHNLKIGIISNEGRELAIDRIARFDLSSFVDFFIVSSFVHLKKPDADIYRLAIDVAQVPPSNMMYIDDRALLVEIGKEFSLQGIHHKGLESTKAILEKFFSHHDIT